MNSTPVSSSQQILTLILYVNMSVQFEERLRTEMPSFSNVTIGELKIDTNDEGNNEWVVMNIWQ